VGRSRRKSQAKKAPVFIGALAWAMTVLPSAASAYVGPNSRIESICLRERTVLRAEKVADADQGTEQKIKLVPVNYCDLSRPGCFAGDDEVSMTLCKKAG
jgi:hypothetical protein